MAVNMKNIEEVLESELRISEHEAKLFVLIVYKGKVNTEMISKMLHWSISDSNTHHTHPTTPNEYSYV